VVLTGGVLPNSEAAVGGNYNLRYLSPAARARLSPFPSAYDQLGARKLGYTLHAGKMYTLYIPSAGFLWSDDLMWAQEKTNRSGDEFNRPYSTSEKSWQYDPSHRAYFEDRFAERLPWTMELTRGLHLRNVQKTALQTASTVHLVDAMAARYLCVINGERIVSEAGYHADGGSDDSTIERSRVGSVNRSKNTMQR
jgi:hypothetical protein